MKTNETITEKEITKKEAPSIEETNKMIKELSEYLIDSAPPALSNQESKPISEISKIISKEIQVNNKYNDQELESTLNDGQKGGNEQLNTITNIVVEEEEPKNNLAGIADKKYFIEKQKFNEDNGACYLESSDFEFSTVDADPNSGYRALSLQIYGNEDNHSELRKSVYIFLFNNSDNVKKYNFERYGKVMNGENYLDIVKNENEYLGDLEFVSFGFLIETEILLFELKDNGKIFLLSHCGKIEEKEADNDKLFLNLCITKGDKFQVIYEKNRTENNFCDKDEIERIMEKNMQKQDSLELNFEYTKDKRRYTYKEIEIFLGSRNMRNGEIYPEFINKLTNENKVKNKKREFRELAKKYIVDKLTGRLKIIFNISNRVYNKNFKEFFIAYQLEKINVIRKIHELTTHDQENCRKLDGMVKEYDFWWYGIHQDIKGYAKHCRICKKLPPKPVQTSLPAQS